MMEKSSQDTSSIALEFIPAFKIPLTKPLLKGADFVNEVIEFMDSYSLSREDWDSIMDLLKYSNRGDPTSLIASNVKHAFTRAFVFYFIF